MISHIYNKHLLQSLKHVLIMLSVFLAVNGVMPLQAQEKEVKDYILILNPDAETCAWGHMLIPPIRKELTQKYPDLDVYVEYMYGLGMTTEQEVVDFKERLFAKYQKAPKYLMLFESDMYAYIHTDIDAHWGNIPTLVLAREEYIGPATNYLYRQPIPEEDRTYFESIVTTRDNLTVVINKFDIPGTLAIMKKMLPDMNQLVFVSDARYISAKLRHEIQQEVDASYPEWGRVVNLTPDKLTTDELIHTFLETPIESGILYFTWFNNEMTGDKDLVLQTNAYRIFSLYVNNPIITVNDVGLKESGMLGGSYTRADQVMGAALTAMDNIIAGRQGKHIIYPPAPIPTFNYLAMLNHDIPMSVIPSNTFLYNRPLTFLERNGRFILGFAFILLLSVVVIRIILLFKTRKMQDKEIKLLEKYGDLFNNMPIAYRQEKLIFNEAGEVIDFIVTEVNPGYEQQLSPRKEIIGRKGSQLYPEMFSELISIYKSVVADEMNRVSMAYYHKESDHYFSVILSLSSTEGAMDVFLMDTTELQTTQQLLRSVNSKLSMSLDIASITPWKLDMDTRMVIIDADAPIEGMDERYIGDGQIIIPVDEFVEQIHEEDRERIVEFARALLNGKLETMKCEYRIRLSKNNTEYDWLEVRATVEKKDKKGSPVSLVGSSVVITDRKNIEGELLTAKEKAEESNRLKTAFLANMSHEIRTPLNAIVGFSNILAATEKEEDKQEYISIIENNNNLLLKLVSDILDLSKIEAGTMELRYTDIDLNRILWELQESTQDRAERGVRVAFDNWVPDCFINMEKTRLLQVMNNLLSNAVKFTTEGEIRFGYRLEDNDKMYFYVSDTGCGISPDQQENVFGRFVKLNHFVQGTGLGLSLCQMIVTQMGGEIGLESEEGKGTTFWFTLPYKPATEDAVLSSAPVVSLAKDKLKVLVAEDNLSNFELFEAVLRNDYHIIHAWNGKEAVDMFKTHQPHIVLMDINMPQMNGYEATVELRKISKDVPIIAVTAYAFSTDEKQIRRNGFSGYSPKPLNAQKLRKQMTDLLGSNASML